MKTSVIESPGRIVIRDAELPAIGEKDVLVKLQGTGICASNLPVWEGREWFSYPFEPGAPGHEGFGKVAAVGRKVTEVAVGDHVALISYNAFAEYDKADVNNVVRIPSLIAGTPFPGEPAACAVNVFKRSEIREGQTVLVIGAGYLGCLLIQLIKNAGSEVAVVSRRKTSLDFAKEAGASHLVQMEDYNKTIFELRSAYPDGFQTIIEATGAQSSLDLATELISVRGRLVIAGYHQDGPRTINMQQWNWRGIDVINAHEREPGVYKRGLEEAVELTGKGILQPEKYITHYLRFENINDAFRLLRERPENFMKAVITY
jgi:2-desacetyl-2-hydroxyethyl bacteriochlorophyllide A dehydrogenase